MLILHFTISFKHYCEKDLASRGTTISNDKGDRNRGVFLSEEPTIERLKACAFFWENIIVFESYLSEVVTYPDLVEVSHVLFKEGVLKICQTPEGLESALRDKIYVTLDGDLKEYLYRNSEKVVFAPSLPKDSEEIINQSTSIDSRDARLKKLIDSIVQFSIESKWLEEIAEYDRIPFHEMPEDVQKGVLSKTKEITDMEYGRYENRGEKRFSFEYRNSTLLEQISVSSALYAPLSWVPYYKYKLGDYSVRDARRYLQSLESVMLFAKRDTVDDFSLQEVLKIRRKKKWNNAMERLAELCNEVKYSMDTKQFSDDIQRKVIFEYQDALGEEETTKEDLAKQLLKGSAFTGISLLPIVGSAVSAVAGIVDPIIAYLVKRKSQRNLPFFLNDLRKIHPLAS